MTRELRIAKHRKAPANPVVDPCGQQGGGRQHGPGRQAGQHSTGVEGSEARASQVLLIPSARAALPTDTTTAKRISS